MIVERSEIEQRIAQIAMEISRAEASAKDAARQVYEAYKDYLNRSERGPVGFYTLMERYGVPRGTAHRYVRVGRALHDGIDPELSMGELAQAGDALLNGATRKEVSEAVEAEELADLAEEKRSGGLKKVSLPAFAADAFEALRKIGEEINPEVPSKIEAAGLGVSFASWLTEAISELDPDLYSQLVTRYMEESPW